MSEDEKWDKGTSREVKVEQDTREAVNIYDGEFYYQIAISSQEGFNPSSLQQIVKDDIFCGNNKENIGRGISKIVQEQYLEVAWITRECGARQGTTVCSITDKGVEQNVGN